MGRFRRMVDVAAEFDVAEEEEDVAKDRLAGTKAYYRMVSLWYRYYLWESSSSSGKMDKKEFCERAFCKRSSEIRRRRIIEGNSFQEERTDWNSTS
jgi:hypothetical protein